METLSSLFARLRVLFRRESVIDDIDQEMRAHVEMETERNIARGMSPERAHDAAMKGFGNLPQMRDIGFERRGGGLLDAFSREVRYSLRALLKAPTFALVVVVVLALGIGATSAVFSLIQGVLLTPPPYQRPDQLLLIKPVRASSDRALADQGLSAAQWMDWQREAASLQQIAAYQWGFDFVVLPDGSQSMEGMYVTWNYFNALGIQPMLGRTFQESETGPNSAPVIILGYDAWRRLFNGDPDIVGKTLKLSRAGTPPTIIGVMPPGVRFLPSPGASQEPNYNVNAQVDYWAPAAPTERSMKWPVWSVVGRLRNGGVVADAQNELNVFGARQAQEDPHFQDETLRVVGLKAELNGEGARILFPLLGAAALVLLIACGNAAALLLVRGLQRQQEYGIRCALGAGRATLFRLVSIESLLLALLGGGIGAGLAFGIVRLFKLIGGHAIPRLDTVTGGWPIVLCGLAAAVAAAGMAGLIPALRASRLNAVEVIKSAGPQSSVGRRERRLLHGVVTAQTALTLALLAGAGLLIRTMNNLANVQPGYDTRHILTMSVTEVSGREHWMDFHTQALERLARLPGVQHVAFAWGVPLTGNSWPGDVDIEGQPIASNPNDRIQVPLRAVTPDYFALLGQTIVEGRDFRSTDLQTAPDGSPAAENYEPEVAIVNQSFVDRYFPDSEAVGKKIWLDGRDHAATQIIGVVFNTRTKDLTRSSEPEIYLSLWQAHAFSKHLVVGASSEPRALIAAVEHELRTIDPTAAVENVKTLDQIRDESQAPRAFATRLLIGFSFVATVLTLVGIYGVLSLSVAARRREIAIRTAVGADRRAVLNMIVGEGLRLIGGGVVIGLAVAAASSWALRSFLFQVSATDPVTLSEVGLLFLVVALMACWAPARRASKVDPMEALRYE